MKHHGWFLILNLQRVRPVRYWSNGGGLCQTKASHQQDDGPQTALTARKKNVVRKASTRGGGLTMKKEGVAPTGVLTRAKKKMWKPVHGVYAKKGVGKPGARA